MTKTRKKSLTDRSAVCKVLQLFPLTADIFVSFLIIRHRVISKQLKTMSCISCSESSIKCLGTSSLWEDISGNRALLTGINALCLSASQYLPISQNRCTSEGRFPISDHQNEHCSNDSLLRKSDGWQMDTLYRSKPALSLSNGHLRQKLQTKSRLLESALQRNGRPFSDGRSRSPRSLSCNVTIGERYSLWHLKEYNNHP